MTQLNRPRLVRLEISAYTQYSLADQWQTDRVRNISAGGICIQSPAAVPVGATMELVISFPELGTSLPVRGKVMWSNPGPPRTTGLLFVDLDDDKRQILKEYIVRTKCNYIQTGPGTIAGHYLRGFWQPIHESSKLAPCQSLTVRVLGEEFTLYRGESGKPHVVAPRCPHRGTLLSTGWVETDSIRCFYHGWKFDADGSCIEQPVERVPFCDKVKVTSYPTAEQLGFIFVYLGEGAAPPLPRWPEFEDASAEPSLAIIPCNYFQSAENIVDDAHVRFSHRAAAALSASERGGIPHQITTEETPFGLTASFHHEHNRVEKCHYLMPNIAYVSYSLVKGSSRIPMRTMFWYVPIDDESHYHVQINVGRPGTKSRSAAPEDGPSVADRIAACLAGKSRYHLEPPDGVQRKPDLIRVQDGVSIVGQGTIADRSNERLGTSDAGVILLRKIWSRELERLACGEPITSFERPDRLEHDPVLGPAPRPHDRLPPLRLTRSR